MKDETVENCAIFNCEAIGVAGTTDVYCKFVNGRWESRVGIAILGMANMSEEELEKANPFDNNFHDNFAVGHGATREESLKDLRNSMKGTANLIWKIQSGE